MKKPLLCLLLIGAWTHGVWAGEKGWFGFGVAIKGEGFFNPTVLSATVDKVEPNSPAAEKGIVGGDEIIQVENTDVAGHKASELKPLLQKQVGETLHLRLKRAGGETYSVSLIAAQKPR
jgi:C-terminal processing protease CtpA/Prc